MALDSMLETSGLYFGPAFWIAVVVPDVEIVEKIEKVAFEVFCRRSSKPLSAVRVFLRVREERLFFHSGCRASNGGRRRSLYMK